MKRRRIRRPANARSFTVGAGFGTGFDQARAQPLAGKFQQPEGADAADLDAGAVGTHNVLDPAFHLDLVSVDFHVDEVDDDQAGQVPELQLPGDFVGRLEVGFQGRFLDVAAPGGAARIDVDGHQRLGRIDDDITA